VDGPELPIGVHSPSRFGVRVRFGSSKASGGACYHSGWYLREMPAPWWLRATYMLLDLSMFLPCTGVVTERTQTQTEESRASSGILGAVVALAPGCLLLAALALVQPFGPTAGVFERSDILLAGLAIVSALGWRLGGGTAGAGWLGAIGGGVTFGLVLPPIGLMVALISAATDAVIRGAANPMTALGPTFAWVLYGIVVVCFYGCMFAIPAGIVWAVVTRALARHLIGFGFGRSRRPTVRLLVALMAIALTAGTSQAIAYSPRNTRCLVLPGGAPTDAAFSPAGDLLAVTMRSDPNAPGTVLLLRWPSTTVVASWTSWVDQEVAVDPAGRVYWSAWTLGDSVDEGPDGVFSAASGSDPALFATGDESELNDLTWTTTGLWGTTPKSHRVARIPLTGGTDMDVEGSKDEVGALWMSPDGSSRIAGPGTFGMRLEVATNIGTSSIAVSGDPRSVALSSDGRTIVEAGWFDGTRLIDVASGNTRQILRGSQLFVALSRNGDLVWANEEQVGQSGVCTSTLDLLS
jgi:hypothetical protein